MRCSYGIAFWYAGTLVRDEGSGYTAGRVMNVIFGAIIAGFSLGQAAPNFGAFASGELPGDCMYRTLSLLHQLSQQDGVCGSGRSAGYRLRQVIDRKPAIDVYDDGVVPPETMNVRRLQSL